MEAVIVPSLIFFKLGFTRTEFEVHRTSNTRLGVFPMQ